MVFGVAEVIVATDDERIVRAATAFGAEAVMTRAEHRSGSLQQSAAGDASVAARGNGQ